MVKFCPCVRLYIYDPAKSIVGKVRTLTLNIVAGITKPGYPGVLIFSGEQTAVDAHCAELRNQRWQIFQVRYDESVLRPWKFSHLSKIVEVETMSEVAQSILDPRDRDTCLRAIGVK